MREHANARWITAKAAAEIYGVSCDWLYRNREIVRMTDGRRLVRFEVASIEKYFRNRTNAAA